MPKRSYKDVTPPIEAGLSERLACPMCGWLRPVKYGISERTGKVRAIKFDRIDVENAIMWRLERLSGKGRGSKEATIELIDSKTLSELDDYYKDQIIRQCRKILGVLGK